MNCKETKKKMPQYFEASLSDRENKELEAHIDTCEVCAKLYQRVNQTLISFKKQKITDANPFFTTRVMALVEAAEAKNAGKPSVKLALKPVLQAVVLAAAIFTGVMFGLNLSNAGDLNYNRQDYIQALGESHYLVESDYTLESLFLTDNTEEE